MREEARVGGDICVEGLGSDLKGWGCRAGRGRGRLGVVLGCVMVEGCTLRR